MQGWDIERDRSRTEEFEIDGRIFIIKHTDPYGYYRVSLPMGKTPSMLDGHFTSVSEAKKMIVDYVSFSSTKQKKIETVSKE